MAQRFLLPCENCDQKIAIVTTQAGQIVRCSGCQSEVKVGTLREIKALASAELGGGSSSHRRETSKSNMSVVGRAVFVVSSLVLVGGLILGVLAMLDAREKAARAATFQETVSEEKVAGLRTMLRSAPPSKMLEYWGEIKEEAVAEWVEHPSLKDGRMARQKRILSWIGFGLAGLGMIAAICTTMFSGKK